MQKVKFTELPISEDVLRAILEMGFEDATPIQGEAIPVVLQGKDIIGQAQTGTGKTAAFAIPVLENIDPALRATQCLVLCPTRELAVQVCGEFKKLSKYKKGFRILPIYGGESIERQISNLKYVPQVVVGTPGRVIDHLERGTLVLDELKMIVLDEADEMLNMGFVEDIEHILTQTPTERQSIFFSATMPKEILNLTRKFQKDPVIIKVTRNELTTANVDQIYFNVRDEHKLELLTRLIETYALKTILIFCNTKNMVDELASSLQQRGFGAEGLHGDLRQTQRNQVMGKFRSGHINILIATDVAARGIDVENIEAVFNYDVPLDPENYVHRIGRTGRAGRSGTAFTFVMHRDRRNLQDIEHYTKAIVHKHKAPSAKEVAIIRQDKFLEKVREIMLLGNLSEYEQMLTPLLEEGISSNVLAAALLKLNFRIEDTLKDDPLMNDDTRPVRKEFGDRSSGRDRDRSPRSNDRNERGGDRDRSSRSFGDRERSGDRDRSSNDRGDRERSPRSYGNRDTKMVRMFLNLGKKDRIRPGDIVGAIAGETSLKGEMIGSIEILDKFSFVDVPKDSADEVLRIMNNNTIKGFKVSIEIANAN